MGWDDFGTRVHGHKLGCTWLMLELSSRAVIAAAFAVIRMIKPSQRSVWPVDAHQFAYPHKQDMISTKMMAVYLVISLGLLPPPLIALSLFKRWKMRQIADDALLFFLGLSGGLLLTLTWIELGKRTISRYRPDFLSRCTGVTSESELSALVAGMKGLGPLPCSADADMASTLLTDGRMSWPSGHSGTSMCVYTFLCCWYYLRLWPYNRLGFWKFALPLGIAMFPLFVGITRILDYRHHWTDVLSGGLVGTMMGLLSFRFYYKFQPPQIMSPEPALLSISAGNTDDFEAKHDAVITDPYGRPTGPGSPV